MIPQHIQKRVRRQILVEVDAPIGVSTKTCVREVANLLNHPMWRDGIKFRDAGDFTKITAFTRKNQPLTWKERWTILLRGQL